jgi:hypothetical protein
MAALDCATATPGRIGTASPQAPSVASSPTTSPRYKVTVGSANITGPVPLDVEFGEGAFLAAR